MRCLIYLLLGLALAVGLVACSSSDPLAVEFTHAQSHEGAQPFVVTGPAVDEGIVCPGGSMELVRLETADGEELTEEDWAGMFDAALEAGTVAEMIVIQEWTCGDGSGGFTMEYDNRFDFATFEFEGQQAVGTWEITEGTGSHGDLSGSGDVALDWDGEQVIYTGEAQS